MGNYPTLVACGTGEPRGPMVIALEVAASGGATRVARYVVVLLRVQETRSEVGIAAARTGADCNPGRWAATTAA